MQNVVSPIPTIGKLVLCALIVALGVAAVAFVLEPLRATFWHLTHDSAIRCAGLQVSVPNGWYSEPFDGGCQLMRPFNIFRIRHEFVHPVKIFINTANAPYINQEQWRQDVITAFRHQGKTLLGETELTVGGIPTICFELNGRETSSNSITCVLEKRAIVNFYYNDQKWKADFDKILRSIQIISSGSASHTAAES
jgi:hypothetical protein